MDGQIPFKVFVFWSEDSRPEVRRFTIDAAVVSNFDYLNTKLQCVCPGLKGKTYAVTWEDEDTDHITISSDEELMVALTALFGNLMKLNVYVKGENKDDDCDIVITAGIPTGIGSCPAMHVNVVCDGCEGAVTGFRYKCTTCNDFDLCSKCEAAGMHPEHCMVRVPSPMMPRDAIKVAVKRSRHFLKTIASAVEENGHKKNRHDKSGERRHYGDRHYYRGEGHGDRHHRRPRSGWFDTFTTYMNEFANLAGDIGLDKEDNKSADPTSQQSKSDQAATSSCTTQAPPKQQPEQQSDKPECPIASGLQNLPRLFEMHFGAQKQRQQETTTNDTEPTCPFASGFQNIPNLVEMHLNRQNQPQHENAKNNTEQSTTDTNTTDMPPKTANSAATNSDQCPVLPGVENIPKLIEMFLNGSLTPYIQQFAQQSQNNQETEQATAPSTANATDNDVEMTPTDPTLQEAAITSVASRPLPSTSEEPVRDASPEKIDGWTMINKDLLDASEKAPEPKPIGFNLPAEFQQRVSINNGENLYPALNVATAVLNPEEPERALQEPLKPKPAPMPPQPRPSAPEADKTSQPAQSQQQKLHPKPHIDAALKQMLAMGFNNEDGWLTQLLESMNGNIAAVMELLTPVKPK